MRGWGRGRQRPPGAACLLSDLAPGERGTIVRLAPQAPGTVASRLRQLGFRPASDVEVVRRAPMGDPTIYRVQDTDLCLRRREARLVEVAPGGGA